MGDGLDSVRAALVAMPDAELGALRAAADESPQFAPSLFAFLSHAVDWELARRQRRLYLLNGPHAAIPPEELDVSFATLALLMAIFGPESSVGRLLGAVGELLDAPPPAAH